MGMPENFQHILRVMNTNIAGDRNITVALTPIRGVGRRYSTLCLKKAEVNTAQRAGELSEDQVRKVVTILQNPRQYKIPDWFLNRKKDIKDGKYSQVLASDLNNKLREDYERMKKIRLHRGIRHYWGVRAWSTHQDHRSSWSYCWCCSH